MLTQLEKLDFYHKPLVIDYYLQGMTYDQLNKKYGIALRHLRKAINEGLEIIKTECRKEKNL
jgi:DNA-directed RNA polymerase specialized sigma24 family protein